MADIQKYGQNTPEYESLINEFMDIFNETFPGCSITRADLKALFLDNLKHIKKHTGVLSFKKPLLGFLSGVYLSFSKTLEYTDNDPSTIYHEMLHALSHKARKKRDSFLKFMAVIYLRQKQLSVREFEEGMTEYIASCMMGEEERNCRFNYAPETTIINKLAKVYGNNIILEYYFGKNNNLVSILNQDMENGFKKVVQLCQKAGTNEEVPIPFENPKYYLKNNEAITDSLLFDLFAKKRLTQVKSVEDFKANLKALFDFYEADLYRACFDITTEEGYLEEAEKMQNRPLIEASRQAIAKCASRLADFEHILRAEWQKLGITDEALYNSLVLERIENFNDFATPVILDYLNYWSPSLKETYEAKCAEEARNEFQEATSLGRINTMEEVVITVSPELAVSESQGKSR